MQILIVPLSEPDKFGLPQETRKRNFFSCVRHTYVFVMYITGGLKGVFVVCTIYLTLSYKFIVYILDSEKCECIILTLYDTGDGLWSSNVNFSFYFFLIKYM